MQFVSARSSKLRVGACDAVCNGVAEDGGLYVPLSLPYLDDDFLKELAGAELPERMALLLARFFDGDGIAYDELLAISRDALSDENSEQPLIKTEEGLYILDLASGSTGRAEDISLRMYARLLALCRKKMGRTNRAAILFSGRAAAARSVLDAVGGVRDTAALAFFAEGESELHIRGALDAESDNARAVCVKSDAVDSSLVRGIFTEDFKKRAGELGFELYGADSSNIARVLPYICCYISAYLDLVETGEIEFGQRINFALPTFDLALAIAGCYAKLMGLPISKLILACNANNALVSLVSDGEFDAARELYLTSAPELDVLVQDNLERFIFELCGRETEPTARAMRELIVKHRCHIDIADTPLADVVGAGWADEDDVKQTIFNFFDIDDCVLDTHTAVAASVYNDYCCETDDESVSVLVSAINPYVEPCGTLNALDSRERNELKGVVKLENLTALDCPPCISRLLNFEKRQATLIPYEWAEEAATAFLKESK